MRETVHLSLIDGGTDNVKQAFRECQYPGGIKKIKLELCQILERGQNAKNNSYSKRCSTAGHGKSGYGSDRPLARGPASDRDEAVLRPEGAMRRLHGHRQREGGPLLPHQGGEAGRRRCHQRRGTGYTRKSSPDSGGFCPGGRHPVRLLHAGHDHGGQGPAGPESQSR